MISLAFSAIAGLLAGQEYVQPYQPAPAYQSGNGFAVPAAVGKYAAMFDKLNVEFGNVPLGAERRQRIALTNKSNAPLKLLNVSSTCKCARPAIGTADAKPGEKLELDIDFGSTSLRGQRSITVYADVQGETWERVALHVSGFIRQDVVLDPGRLDLGVVKMGEEVKRTVRLEYAGGLDWRVGETIPGKFATAQVVEQLRQPGMARYQVVVTLGAKTPRGPFSDVVRLKTNDPASPEVALELNGVVDGGLQASPNPLKFAEAVVGQPTKQRVVLKGDRPFTVAGVRFEGEGLEVRSTNGERTAHMVEIVFTPKKAGAFKETLTLRAAPSNELVSVQMSGSAKAPVAARTEATSTVSAKVPLK
jgi:hypothetical protein